MQSKASMRFRPQLRTSHLQSDLVPQHQGPQPLLNRIGLADMGHPRHTQRWLRPHGTLAGCAHRPASSAGGPQAPQVSTSSRKGRAVRTQVWMTGRKEPVLCMPECRKDGTPASNLLSLYLQRTLSLLSREASAPGLYHTRVAATVHLQVAGHG